MKWEKTFPEIFNRINRGFDCVIGNPPWERMKLQNREFFAASAPEVIDAVNPSLSRKIIEELETKNPELYARYLEAKDAADKALTYVRQCGRFPLSAKGDVNTYTVFSELARNIVAPSGLIGLLVPSGIATDDTTKDFFGELMESKSLAGLYDFENRKKIFPDVHGAFKFCVLLFGGQKKKFKQADFVFFAHAMDDLKEKQRHIQLSVKDITLLNPNTHTCAVFRHQRDAEIVKTIYKQVPIFYDENRKEGGNSWNIKFATMFHQSNDAELFQDAEQLSKMGLKLVGNIWIKGKKRYIPAYEAKMFQPYDHRASTVIVTPKNWVRKAQTEETSLVSHQNPEYVALPRWWVSADVVKDALGSTIQPALLAFRKVTSPTNERTMLASFVPPAGFVDSAQLILFPDSISPRLQCCLLGNLNSIPLDYVTRQKIANVNLNFFIVEQLPIFSPDFYGEKCPWDKKQTLEKWISERALKLTCTSNDMRPLAEAAGFKEKVHKWQEEERDELMAELDAAYFLLYGIEREDVKYILSTFSGAQAESQSIFGSSSPFERILRHYDKLRGK